MGQDYQQLEITVTTPGDTQEDRETQNFCFQDPSPILLEQSQVLGKKQGAILKVLLHCDDSKSKAKGTVSESSETQQKSNAQTGTR